MNSPGEFKRELLRRLHLPGAVAVVRPHALQRAGERGFSDVEIRKILEKGSPEDLPRPADLPHTGFVATMTWTNAEGKTGRLVVQLPDDGRRIVAVTIMKGER